MAWQKGSQKREVPERLVLAELFQQNWWMWGTLGVGWIWVKSSLLPHLHSLCLEERGKIGRKSWPGRTRRKDWQETCSGEWTANIRRKETRSDQQHFYPLFWLMFRKKKKKKKSNLTKLRVIKELTSKKYSLEHYIWTKQNLYLFQAQQLHSWKLYNILLSLSFMHRSGVAMGSHHRQFQPLNWSAP